MLNVKKTLTKVLGTITQILTPTLNTITPLGFFKNVGGGYYQIGKVCIVNCNAYIDGTFAANEYYTMASSLPSASVNSAMTVTTANNAGNRRAVAIISEAGGLVIQSGDLALTHYTIYITGIYITK